MDFINIAGIGQGTLAPGTLPGHVMSPVSHAYYSPHFQVQKGILLSSIQRTLVLTTVFVTKHFTVKSNLLL